VLKDCAAEQFMACIWYVIFKWQSSNLRNC